jgi:hypothetical protein
MDQIIVYNIADIIVIAILGIFLVIMVFRVVGLEDKINEQDQIKQSLEREINFYKDNLMKDWRQRLRERNHTNI